MTVFDFEQYIKEKEKVIVYCGYNSSPGTLMGDMCFRQVKRILGNKYEYLMLDVSGMHMDIGYHLLGTSWSLPVKILYSEGKEFNRICCSFNNNTKKYAEWVIDNFRKNNDKTMVKIEEE